MVITFLSGRAAFAAQGLTFPPNGDNPQASVMQALGPGSVKIDYSSPRVVRGPNDRRGKIWGELVPYGLADLGGNGCKSCPWRGGANENTSSRSRTTSRCRASPSRRARYGLHFIPGKDEWTVIFSKDTSSWGSYWYDAKNDALRVTTKPAKSEYHEWLSYEFTEREPAKVTAALKWEELQVPFTISVDNVAQLWVDGMRRDLHRWSGFTAQNWSQAAAYLRAEQGEPSRGADLGGVRGQGSPGYAPGEESFATLSTLSRLQAMNGKEQESAKTFEKAINHPTADSTSDSLRGAQTPDRRQEGRGSEGLPDEREDDTPNQWPVHMGLMRGYAAVGDYKKAIEEGKLALPRLRTRRTRTRSKRCSSSSRRGKTSTRGPYGAAARHSSFSGHNPLARRHPRHPCLGDDPREDRRGQRTWDRTDPQPVQIVALNRLGRFEHALEIVIGGEEPSAEPVGTAGRERQRKPGGTLGRHVEVFVEDAAEPGKPAGPASDVSEYSLILVRTVLGAIVNAETPNGLTRPRGSLGEADHRRLAGMYAEKYAIGISSRSDVHDGPRRRATIVRTTAWVQSIGPRRFTS